MALDFNKEREKRGDLLKQQFAGQRRQLGAAKGETQRQSKQGFNRLEALVGATGGAIEKARQQEQRKIGRGFAEAEAGIGAQEAQAQQALEQEISGKEFAASEAEKGRAQQREQFRETMAFQRDSWADQFSIMSEELDMNKFTNLINTITALDAAGIKSQAAWNQITSLFGGAKAGGGKGAVRGISAADLWRGPSADGRGGVVNVNEGLFRS